jgi:hypothetical protein
MSNRVIITIVIAAVIAVGSLVGVIVGVSTHSEVTFDSHANPWEKSSLPIGVNCQQYDPEDDSRCDVVENVVNTFNSQLKFKMFQFSVEHPQVVYTLDTPQNVSNIYEIDDQSVSIYQPGDITTIWSINKKSVMCEIRISNIPNFSMLWIVAFHGLGHCSGLGHDQSDHWNSIMREHQIDHVLSNPIKTLPILTDADVSALRKRYL